MKYGIIGLIIAFLTIIGTVVLVNSFRGGNRDSRTEAPQTRVTKLADYANNDAATVTLTEQGRLVGQDTRKAIRITVTKSTRKVEVLSGYEERVESVTEQANSAAAFAAFTRALDALSFGRERDVAQPDERGVCPTGRRFIYRLTDGTGEVMRTWSDSCSQADGPFGGEKPITIRKLFRDQITDYNKLVRGVRL